jgi:hypothetical protein
MVVEKQSTEARAEDWSIPVWVKIAFTIFAVNAAIIIALSLSASQEALFGISTNLITTIALGVTVFAVSLSSAFWFFPTSRFALFVFWLVRCLKEAVCVFSLLGMLYLFTIGVPLFSFRGGIPFLSLVILFLMGLLVPFPGMQAPASPLAREFLTRVKNAVRKTNTLPAWVFRLAVAVLPTLITCSVIYIGLNATLSDYRPYSPWYDETGYWVWIRSFSHAGLDVGYNAPNELIAPATFNHYGEGSPIYVYLYGTIGRLIGWSPGLPVLINFALLALAIFLFTYSTKLHPVQIIFTGLIAVTTWPILLYLPMTTHETLNQAIGFVVAAIFFRLLTEPTGIKPLTRLFFVIAIYLAALTRLSWGLLLVPVIFYSLDGSVPRRLFLALLFGIGLYISATLITSYLVPPANNSIFFTIRESLVRGPRVFVEHIVSQFYLMFQHDRFNPNIAVMFQIFVIIGWSLVRLARSLQSGVSIAALVESRSTFNVYNMGTLALAGLLFYLQEGFYRTFAPSMLVTYLLLAARKDYRFLATLLAVNLAFFYFYLTADTGYATIVQADFQTDASQYTPLEAVLAKHIVFDSAAPNPWCNTLLIPLNFYDYRLTLIPPGIGISYIANADTIRVPIQSKFLLLDQEMYELLGNRLHVNLLESSSIGNLYLNMDSGCVGDSSP